MDNGSKPATPITLSWKADAFGKAANTGYEVNDVIGGLTKREAFAMTAMQGLLAQSNGSAMSSDMGMGAKYCVDMADALLKELEK